MEIRPSHVGLCVTDMERSLSFYCDGLGFERAESYDLDSGTLTGLNRALEIDAPVRVRSQMIRHGAMKVELLSFASPGVFGVPSARRNQLGLTHFSFIVDDVDEVAARLVALGGAILPGTRAVLGYDVLFLTDPDGVRVELMGTPRAKRA